MDDLCKRADVFYGYVDELASWIKEEGKEFPYTENLKESVRGISSAIQAIGGAGSVPAPSQDSYMEAYNHADEFCRLVGLLVETGVLTEIQSRPLLSECLFIRNEIARLQEAGLL